MKGLRLSDRLAQGAPVYMAAVLEYLTAEVLELAGNAARNLQRTRITPRHIQLAVQTDEELSRLTHAVVVPGGGVTPHVEPALLAPKKGKGAAKARAARRA
ncbi:MAG: histone-fold-containing protein [Monoraphidium minutum]|nr:MAG: histone-fold-containing protein [Monoraphidium minutum]